MFNVTQYQRISEHNVINCNDGGKFHYLVKNLVINCQIFGCLSSQFAEWQTSGNLCILFPEEAACRDQFCDKLCAFFVSVT